MLIANYENAIELLALLENELDVLSDNSILGHLDDEQLENDDVSGYVNFVENSAIELQTLIYDFLGSHIVQKG